MSFGDSVKHVQRRNEFSGRATQERTEVNDAQAKSATSSKVTASAACKPNLKSAKVLLHLCIARSCNSLHHLI